MRRTTLVITAVALAVPLVYLMVMGERRPLPSLVVTGRDDEEDDLAEAPQASLPYEQAVAPLVERYCLTCHNRDEASGGIVFEGRGASPSSSDLAVWRRATQALRSGSMPPRSEPQPTPQERDAFSAWVNAAFFQAGGGASTDSRPRPIRRLNRAEYDNTIRDLTGLDLRAADDFPADDVGYGFDNIGEVLAISPLLAERFVDAAEKIVERLLASPDARQRLFNAPADDWLPYGLRGLLPARDPAVKRLQPLPRLEPPQQELERAANILRAFGDRAYRRPITYDELTRLLRFVERSQQDGEGIEPGLKLALEAILVSPYFLFHLEGYSGAAASGPTQPSDDFALASRLSYFLWSSMPDEALYQLASTGKLREPRTLRAQVRRMLGDLQARALVDNFFAQWLQLRNLKEFTPDPARFPDFDEELRAAARTETELFCQNLIREDRSILELLDADYTFVNERLARHYGLAGVQGETFQRVSLAGSQRGGLLTQASILAVTSNPTRTSPTKRGRWILENLLAVPIPSPPPGADDLKEHATQTGTLRQRLERHRTDPQCASCHERMDSVGFGLENFNAVGAWRNRDGEQPIDASGTLAGQAFTSPKELRILLRSRREEFVRCLSEKLLIYALGRGLVAADWYTVETIARRLERNGERFSSLLVGIVLSEPFRQQPHP